MRRGVGRLRQDREAFGLLTSQRRVYFVYCYEIPYFLCWHVGGGKGNITTQDSVYITRVFEGSWNDWYDTMAFTSFFPGGNFLFALFNFCS